MGYCREENIEAVHVADVTDTARMRMFNGDRMVVDLKREFIDSAGAKHYAEAVVAAVIVPMIKIAVEAVMRRSRRAPAGRAHPDK